MSIDGRVIQLNPLPCVLLLSLLKLGSSIVQVRLVDNSVPNAGRVEVRFSRVWSSICDTNWNLQDARVVCRLLGYSQGPLASIRGFRGSGDVWVSSVNCTGNEVTLESCRNFEWNKRSCANNSLAGVVCMSDHLPNIAVRLVEGPTPDQGRVEVRYYGVWGTVCHDTWDLRDAHVVCRMMNYSKASWAGTAKARGSGPILLDNVICRGNEKSLEHCRVQWGTHDCSHSEDAGVTCENATRVNVRLAGSKNNYFGRVEVQFNGTWRPVCDDTWDIADAHVTCRMLGYKGAIMGMKRFNIGKAEQWMGGVECSGDELSISQCYHRGWSNTLCPESLNAAVYCKYNGAQVPDVAVRLVDGPTPNQGRVEVRYYGVWGTVCDDRWGLEDAHVVCRMLNYSKASWAGTANISGSGYIILDEVQCLGNEKSLEYCKNPGWGQHNCEHSEDAGVECERLTREESSIAVRIVGVQHKHYGIPKIKYNGTWRPVCDDTWDIADAHVICRMLGYKGALVAVKRFQVRKEGLWIGGVECSGEEASIAECYHRRWSNTHCHGNLSAGVLCQVTNDSSAQVRLEGRSPGSGRVRVRYGNVWGTICDRGLDINDAKVICRMLGYVGACKVYSINASSLDSDPIWLSDLECNGAEKSIIECRHPGWGNATCNHDGSAAVMCKIANAPQFLINGTIAITDSTVMILFSDSQTTEAHLKSVYQVAVEKRDNEQRFKSYEQPQPFVYNDLNVTMATEMGSNSYITMEIMGPICNFTIGDGQYYHGYYNAPLEPGSMYRAHVRIVTMAMDGKRIYGNSGFVAFTTKFRIVIGQVKYVDNGVGNFKVVAIGLSIVLLLLILFIIGYLARSTLKKKKKSKRDTSTQMSDILTPNCSVCEPSESTMQQHDGQDSNKTNAYACVHTSSDDYTSIGGRYIKKKIEKAEGETGEDHKVCSEGRRESAEYDKSKQESSSKQETENNSETQRDHSESPARVELSSESFKYQDLRNPSGQSNDGYEEAIIV